MTVAAELVRAADDAASAAAVLVSRWSEYRADQRGEALREYHQRADIVLALGRSSPADHAAPEARAAIEAARRAHDQLITFLKARTAAVSTELAQLRIPRRPRPAHSGAGAGLVNITL